MSESSKLQLPYLIASQSQKEVTHNEALNDLDCLVQLSVIDRDLSTPPASPSYGDSYIVGASATGVWSGQEASIAYYMNGWRFKQPQAGWLCFVQDEAKYYTYHNSAWALTNGFLS